MIGAQEPSYSCANHSMALFKSLTACSIACFSHFRGSFFGWLPLHSSVDNSANTLSPQPPGSSNCTEPSPEKPPQSSVFLKRQNLDQLLFRSFYLNGITQRPSEALKCDLHHIAVLQCYACPEAEGIRA
jgi:hypothetical protein